MPEHFPGRWSGPIMTLRAFLIDNGRKITILHRILPYQVVGVFIQIALPGSKAKIRRQHPDENFIVQ